MYRENKEIKSQYGQEVKPLKEVASPRKLKSTPEKPQKSRGTFIIVALIFVLIAALAFFFLTGNETADISSTSQATATNSQSESSVLGTVEELNDYTAEFRDNYLATCINNGADSGFSDEQIETYCKCNLDTVQANYTQDEYAPIQDTMVSSGDVPKDIQEIASACARKYLIG